MTQDELWPHVLRLTESGPASGVGPEVAGGCGTVLVVVLD